MVGWQGIHGTNYDYRDWVGCIVGWDRYLSWRPSQTSSPGFSGVEGYCWHRFCGGLWGGLEHAYGACPLCVSLDIRGGGESCCVVDARCLSTGFAVLCTHPCLTVLYKEFREITIKAMHRESALHMIQWLPETCVIADGIFPFNRPIFCALLLTAEFVCQNLLVNFT